MSSIDDFLNHEGARTTRAKKLGNWKEDGSIIVWLHTQYKPLPMWRFALPIQVTYKEKQSNKEVTKVFAQRFISYDIEATLKNQYKRDTNGQREYPPHDPIGKLVESMYQAIQNGTLDPFERVWYCEGDDKIVDVCAAVFCGYLNQSSPDEFKNKAKKAGIKMATYWQDSVQTKLQYAFAVVDNDKPENGVQLAVETNLLGDKMKTAIHNAVETFGKANADPLKTPYAFKWKFNKNADSPMKMYDAVACGLQVVPLTPEIATLIRDTEPPDDRELRKPYHKGKMRSYVETYMPEKVQRLFNLDWIFDGEKSGPGEESTHSESVQSQPLTRQFKAAVAEPEVELVECDGCGKAIKETDEICPYCGKVYVEATPPPPPPPKAIRKRSELKNNVVPMRQPPPPLQQVDESPFDGDDIPF